MSILEICSMMCLFKCHCYLYVYIMEQKCLKHSFISKKISLYKTALNITIFFHVNLFINIVYYIHIDLYIHIYIPNQANHFAKLFYFAFKNKTHEC